MTNQSEWRWAEPTGQQRLVREDELRAALSAGVIPSNAPVWRPGWKQWKPASEVEELKELKEPVDGVPAPPMFVVVAQNQFEGKAVVTEEPPPPPRYVPVGVVTRPMVPPHHPPSGPTLVDPPRAEPKPEPKAKPVPSPFVKKPLGPGEDTITKTAPLPTKTAPTPTQPQVAPKPVAKPATKPATSKPPPLPKKAKSVAPPPAPRAPSLDEFIVQGRPPAKKSIPPPLPPAAKKSTAPPPLPAAAKKSTAPPPLPAAKGKSEPAPFSSGRHTLPVAPAPPPLPRIDPVYTAPPEPAPPPAPIPQSKFPTLMMFGEDPKVQSPAKPPDEAPPIIVPPPEPSNVMSTGVVTRPPPWGEGAVGIADNIPKAPASPMFPPTEERPSEAPRAMELSSTDLASAARLEIVKPAPLVAAERPRTMMGLGPELVAKNREEVERSKKDIPAPAPEPATPDDTAQQPPAFLPSAPASGAKIHDLREIARKRLSDANVIARKGASQAGVLAKRAYATARERTKDKPPWFLPAVGGGAFVLLVGLIALVVHGVSGGSSAAGSASAAASAGSGAPTAKTTAGAATTPPQPSRPIVCALSGTPRTVVPKALVPSGVEVTRMGPQIALGFATGPKEGVLELLDPSSGASASSLHLPAHDPIRRVLAFGDDKPQAALDSDRKGDRLQGRRTLRASPPIDLGAMDGGLVWAPHGTDKGIKLWSLASDGPVEAIRGEPLPDNKGFAVAFRQSGAIFLSAFGGNPPAPLGPLLRVDGLGPQIGSPTVAASGDKVMVAWADRATTSDPWGLRYAVVRVGDDAIHAQSFTLPPGGLGEQGMSPAVSPLSGGRFLLLWTEGQVSSHQVRVAVFDGNQARGAFTASAEGVNAGQGQGAVLPDGHGVVAFLAGSGKSFEVVATPITCTEK